MDSVALALFRFFSRTRQKAGARTRTRTSATMQLSSCVSGLYVCQRPTAWGECAICCARTMLILNCFTGLILVLAPTPQG